jgi:23S rRNA (uracil1939-C5)-methyltransferase
METSTLTFCKYSGLCGGCPQITTSYEVQCREKENQLRDLFASLGGAASSFEFLVPGPSGIRDKADLSFSSYPHLTMGFYKLNDSQHLIDIDHCPLMSPALLQWYKDIREDPPPMIKASLRLRVSPKGQRGLWVDGSNTGIKELLNEKNWLDRRYSKNEIVEMGQKRKRAYLVDGTWHLKKEHLDPWFETYGQDNEPIPLQCSIASFTQVGFLANRQLVNWVLKIFAKENAYRVLELGAGIGNFTLALASMGAQVTACDFDISALKALARNTENSPYAGNIKTRRLNFYQNPEDLDPLLKDCDFLLVDPPRSGLGRFLDLLQDNATSLPQNFLYISCALPTLKTDLEKLFALGYQVKSSAIVDQFPHTTHCEYLIHLKK